jgi:hypothetical protein
MLLQTNSIKVQKSITTNESVIDAKVAAGPNEVACCKAGIAMSSSWI